MGALQRIRKPTSWLKLPKFQRSARSRAINAALQEDVNADPYPYNMFELKLYAPLTVISAPATMVGFIPMTHGVPFLITAVAAGVAFNTRRLLFLRRLKKGIAQGPAVEALHRERRAFDEMVLESPSQNQLAEG